DIPEAAEHIMWDGLKLIDKYIVPHANNTFYSDAITEVITSNKDNSNFIALDDNQALVVNGDSQKITS
ncbi:MAG: Type 1 glutamine amidotransferase-like domain-containing protein, partial [Candidatus Saccharimonadales bacterium]